MLSLQPKEQGTRMLHVVEIRRERDSMAKAMSNIREWLDAHRFEPDAFRCNTDEEGVTLRLEFRIEAEAIACAKAFGGRISLAGDKFLA
jgi:hypothetical protein